METFGYIWRIKCVPRHMASKADKEFSSINDQVTLSAPENFILHRPVSSKGGLLGQPWASSSRKCSNTALMLSPPAVVRRKSALVKPPMLLDPLSEGLSVATSSLFFLKALLITLALGFLDCFSACASDSAFAAVCDVFCPFVWFAFFRSGWLKRNCFF